MKPLSPKDASILAVIAENPGISEERMKALVQIADDVEEVEAVARWLLTTAAATNGTAASQVAQASALGLKGWVHENRTFSLRE
jgi:hypothetical protein